MLTVLIGAAVLSILGCENAEDTAMERRGEYIAETVADSSMTLEFDDKEVTFIVADSPLTREVMAWIPTSAEFGDYENRLKFTQLSVPLEVAINDTRIGYDPSGGDIAYDTANGTIVVFYRDAEYSDDLIYLGTADSGSEWIPVMGENVEISN